MKRIAHISDSHFDERNRLDDRCRVHRVFVNDARECGVDLIVHSGDVFERRSTAAERLAVAQFLADAAEVAPVVLVRGNHDLPGEVRIFERLNPLRILVADNALVSDRTAGEFFVAAVPWFDKSQIVAQAAIREQDDATRQTIEAARALIDVIRIDCQKARQGGMIPIVVAHTMIGGSTVSTGQVILGQTVEQAPAEWAETGASYIALGHVHKTQEWYEGRVAYAGSPDRMNFGEPEEKGWRLVTIGDDGHFESNRFMPLPARRMVLIDVDSSQSDADITKHDVDGALVRLRIRCKASELGSLPLDQLEGWLREAGAHRVKVEPIIQAETRARAPEIVSAKTVWEKVERYLDAKNVEVDRESLHQRLSELEEAVQ